jgi:hypothetical protein
MEWQGGKMFDLFDDSVDTSWLNEGHEKNAESQTTDA